MNAEARRPARRAREGRGGARAPTVQRAGVVRRFLLAMLGSLAAAMVAAAELPPARAPRVAIDVGHTHADPGAISARGRTEFEFNRELALHVVAGLARLGVEAVLVNGDGRIESLAARPARVPDADFFLSIHHDSVSVAELTAWQWEGRTEYYSDRWAGHSLFVSRRNADPARSVLCARAMGARLQRSQLLPTDKNARRRPYADPLHAVHFFDELVVLHRATQPAVLFEAGVIRHRAEELLLRDPQRQARMAAEIATGIAACLMAGR